MWTAARLVSMTPPAGREATPLPASPSTWPSKEPSTTTTPSPSSSNQDNTSFTSGSETQLRNMSQLAIVGNGGEGEVVIKCLPLAGLSFLWSNNITMKNLKIISCGALQNSFSKHIHNVFLRMQSAIFCSTCKNVQLINVHITESNGTGVVFYNPLGVVNLDMCNFTNNSLSAELAAMLAGGGGLVIEANAVTSQFHCSIANSAFVNNTAKSRQLSILFQVYHSE